MFTSGNQKIAIRIEQNAKTYRKSLTKKPFFDELFGFLKNQ